MELVTCILIAATIISVIAFAVGLSMALNGAVYSFSHSLHACTANTFCDIEVIDIDVPVDVREAALAMATDPNSGKRVNVYRWKAGRTIGVHAVPPSLLEFYKSLTQFISNTVGEQVQTTSLDLTTSCAILIYDREGDFINWHYDVNYFDGRFFTLIIPLSQDDTCTQFAYIDRKHVEQRLSLKPGHAVLFEGENVFHMATKLCKGQTRVVASMQFATDPRMSSWWNAFVHSIKDKAYK